MAEQHASRNGVVFAYCHGQIDADFMTSTLLMFIHDFKHNQVILEHGDFCDLATGPMIADGRNQIVQTFLSHPKEPEWLLMVDTDMVFGADLADRLLEHADPEHSPIVGGLCFMGGRGAKVEPTLRVLVPDGEGGAEFSTMWDYPPDELVNVDATGAACLLIHRRVLHDLGERFGDTPYPWFAFTVHNGNKIGEDVTFCLRARQAGYPIKVHTGIKVGHSKTNLIDDRAYLDWRARTSVQGQRGAELDHLVRYQRLKPEQAEALAEATVS
jgi:hypothetical protein